MIVTGYIGPMHFRDMRIFRRLSSPEEWRPQRMTAVELRAFVRDVADGRIFLAQQVQPFDDVSCVFPAISFLCEVSKECRDEVGTFFEYRDRAAGTARNGQPSFQTVQFIHREDWLLARDLIAAEMLRRERLSS